MRCTDNLGIQLTDPSISVEMKRMADGGLAAHRQYLVRAFLINQQQRQCQHKRQCQHEDQ